MKFIDYFQIVTSVCLKHKRAFYFLGIFLGIFLVGLINPLYSAPNQFSLRFTDTLTLDQRTDNQNGQNNDDDYGVAINRFNFNGMIIPQWRFSGRFDTILFKNPPTSDFQSNYFRAERLNTIYRLNNLEFTAGDFYQQLGKGQLLALRKVDELGLDIALRGGKIRYNDRIHTLSGFGGIANVVNIDMVSQHFVEDKQDIITGGQYGYRGIGDGEIGLLYLYLQPEQQTFDGLPLKDATSSGGIYFDFADVTDWLSVYVETDIQQRRVIEKLNEGYAGYLLLDWHYNDTTVITEGLLLDNFQQRGSQNTALKSRFNYNQGPTLERIDQEVFEFYDVRGGRIRIQHDFWEGDLSLYTNGVYRWNRPNDPLEVHQVHGYGGGDWYFDQGSSRLSLSAGHRFDRQQGLINRVWSHTEGDYVHSLTRGYASHMTFQFQRIRVEQQPFFIRGSVIYGIEKAGLGSLSFEWGRDTQNPQARNQFYAGILSWELNQYFTLKSIVGNQRGGIKCIAGVCREFPAFSGFRLQLIGRHDLF